MKCLGSTSYSQPAQPITTSKLLYRPIMEQDSSSQLQKEDINFNQPLRESNNFHQSMSDTFDQPIRESDSFHQPIRDGNSFHQPIRDSDSFHQPIRDSDSFHQPIRDSDSFHQPIRDSDSFNQPIRDSDSCHQTDQSETNEPDFSHEIERRYCDRFAGFRDDPYGGHWSSPTQSEAENMISYQRFVYSQLPILSCLTFC